MLWVVTFSVFLPSLTSSAVVWANPSPGHTPNNVISNQILFMIIPPHPAHDDLGGQLIGAETRAGGELRRASTSAASPGRAIARQCQMPSARRTATSWPM